MSKKSFILSSAGLRNLVKNQSYGDNFKFIFGEHEIKMKNLFAEFISPYVSQIHKSDPTINYIQFYDKSLTNKSKTNYLSQMSKEIFSLFKSISKGKSIEIDNKQCLHLQLVSILLRNKEMFTKLDKLFEPEEEDDDENIEKKINEELEFLSFLEINSESNEMWNQSKSIEYIASHLYLIDTDKIINLPRTVFYSILTNPKLTIESEDWLLDLIYSFMSKEESEKCENSSENFLSDVYFYEEVNFDFLSDEKLKEFIEKVNPNEMTVSLWNKIKKCFYVCMKTPESNKRDGNGFYRLIQRYAERIVVGGYNCSNQLGQNPNSKTKSGTGIINPPQKLQLDPSSLLSYSSFYQHSVVVTRSGSLNGVGDNSYGLIGSSLTKSVVRQFSDFSMNDSNGRPLAPISALCTQDGSLYMLTKSEGNGRQLVYCDSQINGGTPVFLDISNNEPVSLFGGVLHAAAIGSKGEIIFINCYTVRKSPSSPIAASSLPGGEKATMVACLSYSVLALSSSGRVFSSDIENGSCALKFAAVSELSGKKIVWLSGTDKHCFAVSNEGRVFVRGSNDDGRLGVGKETKEVSSFVEISSLSGHKISRAYAGCIHSLFQTQEGKVLACGRNSCGELLLSSGPSDPVYLPTETAIKEGATFCVASECISAVFIGGDPPPN